MLNQIPRANEQLPLFTIYCLCVVGCHCHTLNYVRLKQNKQCNLFSETFSKMGMNKKFVTYTTTFMSRFRIAQNYFYAFSNYIYNQTSEDCE